MTRPGNVISLPAIPLKNTVLFPHLIAPLSVGRKASIQSVETALASEEKRLVAFAQTNPALDEPTEADLFRVGTIAVIKKMFRSEQGIELFLLGLDRVERVSMQEEPHAVMATVRALAPPSDQGPEIEALHRTILEQVANIERLAQIQGPGFTHILAQIPDPLHQAYLLASMLPIEVAKEQQLLEASTRLEALRLMHEFLSQETQILELREKIASQARTEMSKEQKEYLLRQQMRAIQDELGETSAEQAEVEQLKERLDQVELPDEARKEVARELERLRRTPSSAPDYQITRSYLEFVAELPWTKTTVDNFDLSNARNVLDADHYDLDDVKERIIEHLAVMKLNPSANAPILCFVGPPGVGKTSVGESIARALGRKFERMSLGGMHDEAELRGHRRTYIGAMPGRILQSLRRAGVLNPLMMLDEVDKLGRDFRGDPAAALMEILDPAQNVAFRDNYLNLSFNLSKVFFITTANTLDTVPRPLLDRMETIRLAGYTELEKVEIAKRYLIPRQLKQTGLTPEQLSIPEETLRVAIRRYTREAGVRELERTIGKCARKVAVRFAMGNAQPVTVLPEDLAEMLGPERFFEEYARTELPPGVATGLAWTETGGEILYIEAILLPEGEGLTLTGQIGDVMRESAVAANSYVWSKANLLGIPQSKFSKMGVHIHVPAGAIPKDGPSAGIAIATALASVYTGHSCRRDTAMTGEITLTGLVLPIGGVKEKLLAARRASIKRIVLPKDNEKDLRELPPHLREELEIILVQRIEEAFEATLVPREQRRGE